MIVKNREDKNVYFPIFHLCDKVLTVCNQVKYLGHIIADDMSDDLDMGRQCRQLYAQGNTLVRKFHMCTIEVKITLFKTYCTPLYTAHMWCKYKMYSLRKLTVAYNDAMRILFRIPRYLSATQMFANMQVPTCQAVLRNLMYRFIGRLDSSINLILSALFSPVKSACRYRSTLWKHWRKQLFVYFYD